MPVEEMPKPEQSSGPQGPDQPDLDKIAKKVFQLLLEELEQERDRLGTRNRKA